MKTIWKFNAVVKDDDFTIDMPADAEILHAQAYANGYWIHVNVWAIVDPNTTTELQPRPIAVRGTGHPLRDVGRHITTTFDGALVWHIFEGVQK